MDIFESHPPPLFKKLFHRTISIPEGLRIHLPHTHLKQNFEEATSKDPYFRGSFSFPNGLA